MSKTMKWYRSLVGDATVNAVAEKAGVVQSTLSRQVKTGTLSHEMVAAVARAYHADVLDALVESGLVTRADIRRHAVGLALKDASDVDIAAEVMRRMSSGAHPILDSPLG